MNFRKGIQDEEAFRKDRKTQDAIIRNLFQDFRQFAMIGNTKNFKYW